MAIKKPTKSKTKKSTKTTAKSTKKKYATMALNELQQSSPTDLAKKPYELLYRTYQYLRSIALKRLKSLQKRGYSRRDTFKKYRESFTKKPSLMSEIEILESLLEVRVFLGLEESTARGQKAADKRIKETAKFFTKPWIDTLSDDELERFGDFMDKLRAVSTHYIIYDTESLMEMWNIYNQHPEIENFKEDDLMKAAYEKFLSYESTRFVSRRKYKSAIKKAESTIKSEQKRLQKIKERNNIKK